MSFLELIKITLSTLGVFVINNYLENNNETVSIHFFIILCVLNLSFTYKALH